LVFTVGKFYTDAKAHSLTKVPGEARFTIDFRSQDLHTLEDMIARSGDLAREIAERRRVRFELGGFNISEPALMDAALRELLVCGARTLGLHTLAMPSGAGHDAQEFSHAGFPAAMIFVRNAHGSHNAAESLELDDLAAGTQLLAQLLAQ
jgi:N-carbamoyl-L-amino-acid hydrolase